MNDKEQAQALAILREFVEDVEVVDCDYVREDWPDIHETYHRARDFLKELDRASEGGRA